MAPSATREGTHRKQGQATVPGKEHTASVPGKERAILDRRAYRERTRDRLHTASVPGTHRKQGQATVPGTGRSLLHRYRTRDTPQTGRNKSPLLPWYATPQTGRSKSPLLRQTGKERKEKHTRVYYTANWERATPQTGSGLSGGICNPWAGG